ncbi:MAG: hypothetical protein EA382_07135 [Spirochaetaceae bacterium]|nr:MAG: hypothetical protein EA382_07135 [Spirochaetaceae bacterium]
MERTLRAGLTLLMLLAVLGCSRSVDELEIGDPQPPVRTLLVAATTPVGPDADPVVTVPGMTPVARNDYLELHFDYQTAGFAVVEIASGRVWRSNPETPEQDPIARGENLDRLRSQLYVTFHTRQGRMQTMSSYKHAVSFGNFEANPISGGIRVDYQITTEERIWLIPRVITEDRYNDFFRSNLDSRTFSRMNYYFNFADRERVTNPELFARYPMLATDNLYIFQETSRDKDLPLPTYILEDIERIVLSTGYGIDDLQRDHSMNAVVGVDLTKPHFRIPLEITIDGANLLLTVPIDDVEYDAENYPIHRVAVAEFFGAAGVGSDGYMLVPDGSGSLIHLDNGKHHLSPYFATLYGPDLAIPGPREHFSPVQSHLPVFGLYADGASFLAIVEDGDAFARVAAHVSRMGTSWNRVYSEFTLLPRDELDLSAFGGNNVIQVHQARLNRGDARVRFAFLTGDDVGYERMAALYADYLRATAGLVEMARPAAVPFVLETIGAIDRPRPIMGVPVTVTEPVTTFDQTRRIIDELRAAGVDAVALKLTGWQSGGIRHRYPTAIRYERRLGGRTGFDALREYVESFGGDFFAEVSDSFVRPSSWLTGFRPRVQAAFRMDRLPAIHARRWIHTNTRTQRLGYNYIVSPFELPRLYASIASHYASRSIPGVALRGAGSALSSDFRRDRVTDRQESLAATSAGLDRLRANGLDVMTSGGNAFAAVRSAFVVDVPMRSNQYYLTDESVPFLQMVYSGRVHYAGSPINLSGDHRRAALDAISTGAVLHYRWIYADQSILKDTDYDRLFSVNYRVWIDDATYLYRRYNDAFAGTYGERLVRYDRPQTGVAVSGFANGTTVVVNYNDHPVEVAGRIVAPLDFVIVASGRDL